MFAAAVILFNPSLDDLNNLVNISSYFDELYVYDNSNNCLNPMIESDSVKYIYNGENDGLAIAYNYLIERSLQDGHDWLMLLDQDSIVSSNMVNKIKDCFEKYNVSSIAAFVPLIQYDDTVPKDVRTHYVKWAINSGMTLNLRLINLYELRYDTNIFLDRVDRDFSKQIELKGLKIVQVEGAVLKHRLGDLYNGHIVHSPMRNYYICENRLYYNKKYYSWFVASILSTFQTMRQVLEIIVSNYKVIENLKMVMLAIKDYSNVF